MSDNTFAEFWMVWNEKTCYTQYRHYTRDAAEKEAARMARGTGDRMYVLKAVASCEVPPSPVWKLGTSNSTPIPF